MRIFLLLCLLSLVSCVPKARDPEQDFHEKERLENLKVEVEVSIAPEPAERERPRQLQEAPKTPPPPPPERQEVVRFPEIREKILTPQCLYCHNHRDMRTEKGLRRYLVPGDPDQSDLITQSEHDLIPENQAPITPKELDLLRNYILNLKPSTREEGPPAQKE